MAISNSERINKSLDILNTALQPYVAREMEASYGKYWVTTTTKGWARDLDWRDDNEPHLDIAAHLRLMWDNWNEVFGKTLGRSERSIVSELRDVRNSWAHQKPFTTDDTYRALDSIQRLLFAISAAAEADEVDRQKQELLRTRFEEQARREQKRVTASLATGNNEALRPWREIITPHPDVAAGRYTEAEFAADLSQVHRGEGSDEYRDPQSFFQRTYLTEGLRYLLKNALLRLGAKGGDPVVELQTNFGGGKTHSMLALYHLCSDVSIKTLSRDVEDLLKEVGVERPVVQRAVLVGTALSPGMVRQKPDGTVTRTLWGELAWQLMGRDGYNLIADADQHGVSPGSETLATLLAAAAPCLILIDEWVAFVRQLYDKGDMLPAGSFDANLTFAQALTEAARATPGTLVVATLPASDIEVGGDGGREALLRLRNTFARMESAWRPASTEEGFEIVRRRLFQPLADPALVTASHGVIKAFMDLYRSQSGDFPSECREADYERRMRSAYPIHPEFFDRLYNDWSSLERFQRTRGVLRLVAAVIRALWKSDDRSPLIMPASIPIDDPSVQPELTSRYLEDNWLPVIEKDVDGPSALSRKIDDENPNLGRYSAARRVARTIYIGSAPTAKAANRGLEDKHIRLGCVFPGETPAIFGDALRRLNTSATFLYQNGQRYWFATQPSLNRLAQDRAEQRSEDDVHEEIIRRLKDERSRRGDFAGVHIAPASGSDVEDTTRVRLVILGSQYPHTAKEPASPARTLAQQILDQRGSGPRIYRNTLVFLAPDKTRLEELQAAVRAYLAWNSIVSEHQAINLDASQLAQAKDRLKQANDTVVQRMPETYQWLLVPIQEDPRGQPDWDERRLNGQGSLAERAAQRLRHDDHLCVEMGGTILRRELDRVPLWRGDHVEVKELVENFAKYLYLPRISDEEVIRAAIGKGVALTSWNTETFAYAERYNAETGRYEGLQHAQQISAQLSAGTALVRPEIALRQIDADAQARAAQQGAATGALLSGGAASPAMTAVFPAGAVAPSMGAATTTDGAPRPATRYHGTATIDAMRISKDVGQIADAVLQHLVSIPGATVRVTLEIEANIPGGASEQVVRTVTENGRTLKFENGSGFD